MTSIAKYVLTATPGNTNTLLDLRLKTGTLSLSGQTATVTGSTAIDAVYASKGMSVDFTTNTTGADALYLDGVLADYTIDTATAGVVKLTRLDDANSVYTVGTANAAASVVFANGSILANTLTNISAVGDLNAAVTSLADPVSGSANTENVQLGNAGVITATSLMGKLTVRGSAGVDQVFVKAGATVDATQIGGSNDVIWLTGKWTDYQKSASGNILTLTRTIDGKNESVTVIAGSTVTDDKLMFADGFIYTKTALTNGVGVANAAKTLSAAGGIMSHKAGEFTDVSNLGASLDTTLKLMTDGGVQDPDYVTNDSSSTLKGSYTGTLEVGDKIQISLNNGNWVDATIDPATKTFTYAAALLAANGGVNNIRLAILPANGVTLAADRLHVITLANGGTVTLDSVSPTGDLAFFAPGDSTLNKTEADDASLGNISLKVTLDSTVKVGDVIQLQSSVSPAVLAGVGLPYTVTAADVKAGFASVNLPKNILTGGGIPDAAHTVKAVFTDAAGNPSTTSPHTLTITVDTDGPQASFAVSATADAAGTGVVAPASSNDKLNANETSVVFAVTYDPTTHPLTAGDTIQIISNGPNGQKVALEKKLVAGDFTAEKTVDATHHQLFLSVNKSAIAGAITVDGTYDLTIKTFDAAGNTYTDLTHASITVDSVAVSASLSVSTVGTDGVSLRVNSLGGNSTSDPYLATDENDVVVKVDSSGFGAAAAFKEGDTIELKHFDATANSNAGGYVSFATPIMHTVTAAEATAGAAYIQVLATALASGTNKLSADLVDGVGNTASALNVLAITKAGTVDLAFTANITDLEVTSNIVLTASQPLAKALTGTITFTHKGFTGGGNGFDGQTTGNTVTVDVSDSRYVKIEKGSVVITPAFDFDFSSDYEITVSAGAFATQADLANGIPASQTAAVSTGAMTFKTAAVGANAANAVQAEYMTVNATTGAAVLNNGKKWFAVANGATEDVGATGYAAVLKDGNAAGSVPDMNDGVGVGPTIDAIKATIQNFGTDDLIYVDDQKNDPTQINNSKFTQIANYGAGGDQIISFDATDGNYDGAVLTLQSAGVADVDSTVLRSQLNVSNTKTPTPTSITHIQRVDASGDATVVDATDHYGLGISDAQPLRIKISAPDLKAGDKVQLSYEKTDGTTAAIGTQLTASAADVQNGYVILSLTKTQLTDPTNLFNQEGYNKVWASITNTNGAISTSTLLGDEVNGGGNGFYLDLTATTPTIQIANGADATLTSAENSVDLVVARDKIKVGDTLTLKLGNTVLATQVITDANVGSDVTFTVNKTALALGGNALTLTNKDAEGNSAFVNQTITRSDFVTYTGTVGLGPVTANDLQVTAYDKDGKVLSTSTVATDGTYTLIIDKTQAGAITLRVANSSALITTPDYKDEASGLSKDIGAGASIAAITVANGANQTVHITALTDLVARHLTTSTGSTANTVIATDANIAKYNLALTQAFVNTAATDAATQGITSITPTFTVTSAGVATTGLEANKYGQLLAQISKQAAVNGKSMDEMQTLISNAITWNDTSATITSTADTAKQVVLLTKVAQAAALTTGASASAYLSIADITGYFESAVTGPITSLSAARKADLLARIVAKADSTTLDEITELQALTNQVVALAKIQDYAANSANPVPTLADYTAAGVTDLATHNVTADNLTAVNIKLVGSSAATGTVPVDDIIKLVVAGGVQAQKDAVTAIATYAQGGVTAPSLSTYALAGVTGVTSDNLAAINKKIFTTTDLDTPKTINAASATDITLANIQTEVTEGIATFTTTFNKIHAYIIDSTANLAPDATDYSNIGLDLINTPEEVSSANYYLTKVMVNENAMPGNAAFVGNASLLAKLTAQNTAIAKIDAYALDTGTTAPTPTLADYQAAGLTLTSGNVNALNNAVRGKALTAVDTASELAALYDGLFAGVPSITSITTVGVGTIPAGGGTFALDSYLNNAELTQAGQTAKFTVNFDRGVTGVAGANFSLTDSNGAALTFPSATTPTITATQTDTAGKVWSVTVSGFATLTSGSLRLNLLNNTNIVDKDNPTTALSQSTYTPTTYYTVDKTNTVVLEDNADQDSTVVLTSAAADNTFMVHVKPDNLRVGDVLTFAKVVGGTTTTLGSVNVAAGDLATGVTYTVSKSEMGAGGSVQVTSTDLAGNTGTSTVTVTVNQYVTIQGTLGLSSKLLTTADVTDLAVEAFDKNGVLLGTGTINPSDSTYTVSVLNTINAAGGLVKIQLRSLKTGTFKDYFNEGSNAAADLEAGAIVSSTVYISAGNTAATKTANLTLLTDLASRIIAREYPAVATDVQVTAVNTAVTKLLLSLSTDTGSTTYTPITSLQPDFAVTSLGADDLTATRYGNLLTQLSQQAADNFGGSLDVVLRNFASGITWNTGTSAATLNTDFAKQVVLLAKTQMAAALSSVPAGMDAVLSFQDLIDGGVTGLSALTTAARKAALIASIVNTADGGDAADSLAEIQALANKAIATAKIQDYADLTASGTASQTPSVTDYSAVGITGVTPDNLAAVNKVVLDSSASAIPSTTSLQQLVTDTGIALYNASINTIKAYAAGGATAPTANDYLYAGVTGVDTLNLSAVNKVTKAAAVATAADTTAAIQALAATGVYNYGEAMTKIKNYITDISSATGVPDSTTYANAGLPTIDTAGEVESANQYLDKIMSGSPTNANIVSALSAQQAALLYINEYAANNTSHAGVAPTTAQYKAAGITSASDANLGVINNLVDTAVVGATTTPADLSTFAKLKTLLDSVFATSPTLTAIVPDGTSIVNGAYQTDGVLNKNELSGSVKFKLTFSRAVTGVDTLANFNTNFALVDSGGNEITGLTLNPSVTTADGGLNWTVSVSGLSTYVGTTLGLKLKNNTGIADAINGNSLSNSSLTGTAYTIDTTFNQGTGTLAAKIGQDLTLDGGESSVDIFVDASKLQAGDKLDLFLGAGTTSLLGATPYTVSASDALNGAKVTLLKSALTAGANSITLKHTDLAGNVGTDTGTITVNSAVTYTGIFGAGPVTAGADLKVTAYDKTGKVLSSADINATTGSYSLTIDATYTGPLLLSVTSKTATGFADYIDEATNAAKDLGNTTTISAVVNAAGVGQTVNITTLTDIAARLLTVSSDEATGLRSISSDLANGVAAVTAAKVTQVNTLVAQQFIGSSTPITALAPSFTVDNTAGAAAKTDADRYGQVLAQLSDVANNASQSLAYVQGRVAADLGYTYSVGGGTLTAGQLAKDVTFLAKVAQAAQMSSVDASVLSTADITAYGGITGFASLNTTRQADVVKRIVDGATDGSATDSIAEVIALTAKVNAIGIIQDYRNGGSTVPTLETYLTAGFNTVTAGNVAAVNAKVLIAPLADITTTPDTAIATAITAGSTSQTTALDFLVNYAKNGTGTVPTVQDYANAGISNVTAANLPAVNAKVRAIADATADATVKSTLQTVVNDGVIQNSAAITVIRNYLAAPTTATVPTLSDYTNANLDGGVITTAAQAANANYLLSKSGVVTSAATDTQVATALTEQVAAFTTLNTYAVSGGTAPVLSVYQKAGFTSLVNSTNLSEINERVNLVATHTMSSTTDLLTAIKAIDLVAGSTAGTQLGIQAASTLPTLFTATAATPTTLFGTVNASYAGDSDIKTITITINGAIDATNDKIVFGSVTRTLNTTAGSNADVTLATVTGVSWSYSSDYNYNSGTPSGSANLVFTKTDGTAFTAAQAQLIEKAVQFRTVGATSTVQGNRVFTLKHTDTSGVDSSSGASTVVVDSSTDAVDLDSVTAGIQANNTAAPQYVNAADAVMGKALVGTTVAAPTATDIKQVQIVMGGAAFDSANATLKINATDRSLAGDFSATAQTIGAVSGLTYTYTASTKTLLISKADGTNFTTQANIPAILGNIYFKTTSAVQGDRTATISYIDAGGNVGSSAKSTLTVDTAISAPTVYVTSDDGLSGTDKITTGGLTIGGIAADSGWKYSLTSATGPWTTASGTTLASSALGGVGAKTIYVQATDTAGNTATTTYSFTLASPIAKTVSIDFVADDAALNASTTTTGAAGSTVASGATTDDTTPTLKGTLGSSAVLATGEVVAIYEGTTKIGNAGTVGSNAWSFTLPALSTGTHSFTARVENTTGAVGAAGAAGSSSGAYTLNINPSLGMTIVDDVGLKQAPIGQARYIMLRRDASVDFNFDMGELEVFSNGVDVVTPSTVVTTSNSTGYGAGLTDGLSSSSANFFAMWDVSGVNIPLPNAWVQVDLGAVYDISSIKLTPRAAMESRMNSTNVFYSVNDMSAGAAMTSASTVPTDSAVYYNVTASTTTTTVQTLTMSAPTIDDTTPTFSGTLSVPLGTGEELAIYDGTSRLAGNAVITGSTWTFTPSTALTAGAHTFKAMVHATTDTTGVLGRVVSATSASITINSTSITNTPGITNVSDNVVNSATISYVSNSTTTTTDDTTPTLNGTVAALGADQAVAIYNGSTRLGYATTSGTNWTFTPTSALPVGAYTFTARVENTKTGQQGPVSSQSFAINIDTTLGMTITDSVGIKKGAITTAITTDDNVLDLNGTLDVALGTNEIVNIYDGATKLGQATVNAATKTWTYTTSTLSEGAHTFTAVVQDSASSVTTTGRVVQTSSVITVNTVAPTATLSISMTDDTTANSGFTGTVLTGTTTDDTKPLLKGTITGALGANDVVAVYDTVGGVTTKLGDASVANGNWSYTTVSPVRYVMVKQTGASSRQLWIDEVQVWSADGLTNLARNPGVSVSTKATGSTPLGAWALAGIIDGGIVGTNAVPDGFAATETTSDNWVMVDLGAAYTISSVKYFGLTGADPTGGALNDTAVFVSNTATPATFTGAAYSQLLTGTGGAEYLGGVTTASLVNEFKAYQPLAVGAHSFSAVVENKLTGVQSTPTSSIAVAIDNSLTISLKDSAGTITGSINTAAAATTDDLRPEFSGDLGAALAANDVVAVYKSTTVGGVYSWVGNAAVTGTKWTYLPTSDLSGTQYFKAVVQASSDTSATTGRLVSATTSAITFNNTLAGGNTNTVTIATLTDNDAGTGGANSTGTSATPAIPTLTSGAGNGYSTDDTTPVLSGSIGRALSAGESLVLYDTYNGTTTKVGSTTAASGLTTLTTAGSGATTTWTYTPAASIGAGQHKFSAAVENTLGVQGSPTAMYEVNVYDAASRSAMTVNYVDNVGVKTGTVALSGTSYTDDARPSFTGSLPTAFALGLNEELALYKKVGAAFSLVGRSGATTPTLSISGTTWSVAEPASDLLVAGESTTFMLMVQPKGDTLGATGRVVSASSSALIYSTTAPSQTTTIVSMADDQAGTGAGSSTNPTETFTKDAGGLPIGVSTDDTIPALSGTISTALYAGQKVVVYDSVDGGVATAVAGTVTGVTAGTGTAIGSGLNWVFTPSAALSAGKHSFTARVESDTGEFAAFSADARVVNLHTSFSMVVADDVGKAKTLTSGSTTDDNLLTMSGTLTAALDSTEELAVYQTVGAVTTKLAGVATVSGLNWTFTPTALLADGAYTFKAMVQATGSTDHTKGRVVSASSGSITVDTAATAFLTQTTTITDITDNAGLNGAVIGPVLANASTDDTTLVLTGTISAPLAGANQRVVVYDTFNGVTTEVAGTVAGLTNGTGVSTAGSGTAWTFTPTNALTLAQAGTHSFTARVENIINSAQAAVSNAYAAKVFTGGLDVSVSDNAGALQGTLTSGASTDDTTPTLSGSLSAVGGLSTGDEVAVYQTLNGVTSYLGVASLTGSGATLGWSYTPSSALAAGDYTFKAMVQPVGDKLGLAGKVVSSSQIVKVTATDTTFDAITPTTDTTVSASSYKALAVTTKMTLDMNANSHADFDVLNLNALSSSAKIDLADVVQGAKGLFTSAKFATVSGAGLAADTSGLDQFLITASNGGNSKLEFAGPATTWTAGGVVSNNGHTYDVYNSGTSQLLIDQWVTSANRTGFTVI